MINIDRDSSSPIFRQLAVQLRYLIATGHYQGRKHLPSTRKLASTLGISFHTVRKAYQELEAEGILQATVGSGYRIKDPSPLGTSERIEKGAAIVEDTLHQLAGLGLGVDDMEYLFDDQMTRMNFRARSPKVVFMSSSDEVAAMCAADVSDFAQCPVEPVSLARASRHRDAEYALAEFRHVSAVRDALPKAEVIGVATALSTEALDRLSRLLPTETVGLLTVEAETVRYVMDRIKFETRFGGQILATPSADSPAEIASLAGSVDLLVYTPALGRRVARLRDAVASVQLSVRVTEGSRKDVLDLLPSV